MAKVKKNLKHERFENPNFNIFYDINYDKKIVVCTLNPKQEFIDSLNRRVDKVFKDGDGFCMESYSAFKMLNNKYLATVEDNDSDGGFDVEACKALAYYGAVEILNNDWHNATLKLQKFIAAKTLDASRIYTSYSSIMLKRAKGRLEKKLADAEDATDNAVKETIAETAMETTAESSDNNSVAKKVNSAVKICKKLFTK